MDVFYEAQIILETDWVFSVVYQIVHKWSALRHDTLPPGDTVPCTHWAVPWVGPKDGTGTLETTEISSRTEIEPHSVITIMTELFWVRVSLNESQTKKQTNLIDEIFLGGLVATKLLQNPPAHPEDGDGVSCRNVAKPSHPDAAVCPRNFHCIPSPRKLRNLNRIDITENKQKTSIKSFPYYSKHSGWLLSRTKKYQRLSKGRYLQREQGEVR